MPPKGTKLMTTQGSSYGTNLTNVSLGPVMLAYGANTARILGWLRQARDNFVIKPRYRKFTARPDEPDEAAWTDGTTVTGGEFSEDFDLTSLGAYMWIQPAIGGKLSAAGNGGDGFIGWQAFTKGNGVLVAKKTVTLNPEINSTKTAYIPLGNPFPALSLAGLMIAVSARGISGSPTINFATRTFEGDLSLPSAWSAGLLGTNKTLSSINEDYNTGDKAFAPSDVGFAQAGLMLPAVDADGTLDILVAAKYS